MVFSRTSSRELNRKDYKFNFSVPALAPVIFSLFGKAALAL